MMGELLHERKLVTPAVPRLRPGGGVARGLAAAPRVRAQAALGEALNRAPAVVQQARRGAALSRVRGAGTSAAVQRFPWSLGLLGGGAAAGAYAGSYLDAVLPYRLGTLGGGVAGGALGYLSPSALRRILSSAYAPTVLRDLAFSPLATEVNREGGGYRTFSTPQVLADQLAESSGAFRKLRTRASGDVRETLGRDLRYVSGGTGGHAGAYGGGDVRIDEDRHPAVSVPNLVFETANAAQTGFFDRVRRDHEDGSIQKKGLDHYAGLLGRDVGEMKRFAGEYEKGDAITRRALVQEWGEWNSLQLARAALKEVRGGLTGRTATDEWEKAGWDALLKLEGFDDYYELRGQDHRPAVESALRRQAERR